MLAFFTAAAIAASTLSAFSCDVNGVSAKACFEKPTIEYRYPNSK
jgi:hypothetical protein